jgi:hypothetical protein
MYLFIELLSDVQWVELAGGAPQILAIFSFSSMAFPYHTPIFGYGYIIPLFVWILTGIFCGLLSKSTMRGALITVIGLMINVLIFIILTTMDSSYIPHNLHSSENALLLGGFSLDFLLTLGLFLIAYSLTLPGSVLGGVMGGMVSRIGVAD